MSSAERARARFNACLTDTCSTARASASYLDDGDQRVGDYAAVVTEVACVTAVIGMSNDMIAAGPEPANRKRIYLPAGTDIARADRVTLSDATVWTVEQEPEAHEQRGEAHHIEAVIREVSSA
jgi:hypothetical protein